MTKAGSWTLPRPQDDGGSRVGSWGVSGLVHALVVALILAIKAPFAPRPGPDGWLFNQQAGDPGGGAVHLLQLPAPPAGDVPSDLPALPSPVAPVLPDIAPAQIEPRSEIADCFSTCGMPDPGAGAGSGGGVGVGVGPASGAGSGAGSGGGGAIRPPAPLTILMPPTATAAVRGKGATVLLQVDTAGAVRDAAVVVSSGDRSYDEALRRIAMGWRFRPARDAANRPVPYPFEVSLKF